MYCPKCDSDKIYNTGDKAVSGKDRWKCKECGHRTTNPLEYITQIVEPKSIKISDIRKKKCFVISCAVNNTELVPGALASMEELAKYNDAQLIVVPTRYKNPSAFNPGEPQDYWWPSEVIPYFCNVDFKLNKNLVLKAGTSIQVTTANPLAGFSTAGTTKSEIYAHPQIAMEMVANPRHKMPKMLHTTGTLSMKNYSNSVAGKKAAHHHSIGALVVEIEGNKFWTREVNFDGEGVADLDCFHTPEGTYEGVVEGIVYGDSHAEGLDPKINKLLESLGEVFNPNYNVFHDVHDHSSASHHNVNNVLLNYRKALAGKLCVRSELMAGVEFLRTKKNPYVVDSNHDRHLNQWFNRFDPKKDPHNISIYFELADLVRKSNHDNLFQLFIEQHLDHVKFVDCDDVFMVAGVDCSQHGDRGPNGSRGSMKSLAKAGHKMVIGHSHTAGIHKSVYQVGVSDLNHEYAKGLSSWTCSHCLIYDNGKRCIFHLVDGKLSPRMRKLIC